MATIEDLKKWLGRDLSRYAPISDHVLEHETQAVGKKGVVAAWGFRIYTDNNSYSITARIGERWRDKGYLGCIASSRKPRAGEDWRRGSDLADGSLSEATWHRILADIMSYELVRVHRTEAPRLAAVQPTPIANIAHGECHAAAQSR